MKTALASVALLVSFAGASLLKAPAGIAAPTTIVLVRHADRVPNQDALTSAGAARAKELAHVIARAGIAGVYCTKTVRSRKTAEPAAESLKLAPVELDPSDTDGLVKKVLTDHRGKTVLVVGHSNTIPRIIAAAGGPTVDEPKDDDFDDLYVLTIGAGATPEVRLAPLQYGAGTP